MESKSGTNHQTLLILPILFPKIDRIPNDVCWNLAVLVTEFMVQDYVEKQVLICLPGISRNVPSKMDLEMEAVYTHPILL